MPADKKNEVITTHVIDVHSLVEHGLQTVHRQVESLKKGSFQDAKAAVSTFENALER